MEQKEEEEEEIQIELVPLVPMCQFANCCCSRHDDFLQRCQRHQKALLVEIELVVSLDSIAICNGLLKSRYKI